MTSLPDPAEIVRFHDERVADRAWANSDAARHAEGAWQWIEANHRFNNLLWDEEDLARRKNVPDSSIATNKRAIDGYNQKRNDAIERHRRAASDCARRREGGARRAPELRDGRQR